jgi:5-methylcytosine-specific restriction enzyme A
MSEKRQKVTKEAIHLAYSLGLQVYRNHLSDVEAKEELMKTFKIAGRTAEGCIDGLLKLLTGQIYYTMINEYGTEYYLEQIKNDFGNEGLLFALQALKKHSEYFAKRKENGQSSILYPAKILKKYSHLLEQEIEYADELKESSKSKYIEGAKKEVIVNAYERDSAARAKCLDIHGYKCSVCNFDFLKEYGELGRNYIHVHHITDLSSIGKEYDVDPRNDLIPVCPNCHSMLHRDAKPARTVEALKSILQALRDNQERALFR